MSVLWSVLAVLLRAVLEMLVPMLLKKREDSSEDGARRPKLRRRLRDRVRSRWGATAAAICLSLVLLAGCSHTRTIYVPAGEPVRLRETVRKAKVWVVDKDGKPVAGVMDLPEGWYCLPDQE